MLSRILQASPQKTRSDFAEIDGKVEGFKLIEGLCAIGDIPQRSSTPASAGGCSDPPG